MPWSKNKTVPALEDKSDADKELFARVANAQLHAIQQRLQQVFRL